MKHNASPEKNANAKGMSDYDSGKTTNKGNQLVFYGN